jgi:ferredoxin
MNGDREDDGPDRDGGPVEVTVLNPDFTERATLRVERGTALRRALLDAGVSPYTRVTERANCGGRGLCATCGVWIDEGAPDPTHWHDGLAERWAFPRLSCRVTVDRPLTVRLPSKLVWGFGGRRRE